MYIILLSFLILPTFLLEVIRAQLRLNHDNKNYAFSEVLNSLILLLSIIILSYSFEEKGYAVALLITPIITSFFFISKIKIELKTIKKIPLFNIDFWKYGFFASLSNVVTQLLFVIDILLIGYLLNNSELVTNYRYISLVPFSLLFLPRVFIITDFVTITENIFNKKYVIEYIKNYLSLFTVISILMTLFCWFFSADILILFEESYSQYILSFRILIIGISGIFIFRNLFGNLLSSIGFAKTNYYIAMVSLTINIISNFFLIPLYGILGAAITTAVLMWISGILSGMSFWYLYTKKLSSK
ncbi:MAG: Uncharacterised protein [Polaribacter sp. SA4-10]|nr:MAG: Uncharacterised protein [Polaribacter sp. SA4-10]